MCAPAQGREGGPGAPRSQTLLGWRLSTSTSTLLMLIASTRVDPPPLTTTGDLNYPALGLARDSDRSPSGAGSPGGGRDLPSRPHQLCQHEDRCPPRCALCTSPATAATAATPQAPQPPQRLSRLRRLR